ncbi:hypothetical protein VIGAN_05182600 [Vigna angularis var. angularis]|uniref:Bowman-Birk serine protease inhibitors family domain-containing protein n=1 Tax=Vigna angularis var. angularis TaxID=157739 RepID=A0A0S3S687_PHAAN|nr:hypothetical protein VIGAN_05182600 [Vigna angularis var. angularis]
MAKTPVLFPCLMVLCLVIFATGFVNGCNYPCHDPSACVKMPCEVPNCIKRCHSQCCVCQCLGNEKPEINM